MNRNILCLALVVMLALCFAGCSSNSPAINPGGIRVTLSTPPPAQMSEGAMAMVTATVTGDKMNGGVNWTCSTTGAVACGAANFSATQTASGTPTTFTAPVGVETVKITATSVTDMTKSASANVSVVSGIAVTLSTPPPANMVEGSMAMVTATVTGDSMNGGVNWTCSTTGATPCGAGNFSATQTASGVPTTFTAPGGAETVTVTATSVTDMTQSASANVNVTTGSAITGNYSFYASGMEVDGEDAYVLAGAVLINADGTLTGEQDFNDADGFTFSDQITSGSLAVDTTTGLGTLTLVTANTKLGANGTETIAVSFTNNNHAQIIEFDASATSTGSMDLQTGITNTPIAEFAFAVSGVDTNFDPVALGGVVNIGNGGTITSGTFDTNDFGNVTIGTKFDGGTFNPPDSFGRGTITNTGLAITLIYYNVGPEAMRIIDMDAHDMFGGSAFGQGDFAGGFSVESIGNSVFHVESNLNPNNNIYSAVGQFEPTSSGAFTAGVGDANVNFSVIQSSGIMGTFSVMPDGYGSLSISPATLLNVANFGMYLVDPNLNINDPNNPSGSGGALLLDTDDSVIGTGQLVPVTENAAGSFAGNYSFVGNEYNVFTGNPAFFGFLGQGSVTANNLVAAGSVNDLFNISGQGQDDPITYSGTVAPDGANPGRYLLTPLDFIIGSGGEHEINTVIYQASANQLFWIELDNNGLMSGGFQTQIPIGVASNQKKATAQKKKTK